MYIYIMNIWTIQLRRIIAYPCYQAINYVTACLIFDRDAANWPKTIFCVNHLLFKKNICISRIFSISIKFSVKYINEESWRFSFVLCLHTPFFHEYLALISRSNDILTVMCIQNFEELNYWGICLTTLEISHDAKYIQFLHSKIATNSGV